MLLTHTHRSAETVPGSLLKKEKKKISHNPFHLTDGVLGRRKSSNPAVRTCPLVCTPEISAAAHPASCLPRKAPKPHVHVHVRARTHKQLHNSSADRLRKTDWSLNEFGQQSESSSFFSPSSFFLLLYVVVDALRVFLLIRSL